LNANEIKGQSTWHK